MDPHEGMHRKLISIGITKIYCENDCCKYTLYITDADKIDEAKKLTHAITVCLLEVVPDSYIPYATVLYHHACDMNEYDALKYILPYLDKSTILKETHTGLMRACRYGYSDLIDMLLEYGINVNAIGTGKKMAAIHFAIKSRNIECVRKLINIADLSVRLHGKDVAQYLDDIIKTRERTYAHFKELRQIYKEIICMQYMRSLTSRLGGLKRESIIILARYRK